MDWDELTRFLGRAKGTILIVAVFIMCSLTLTVFNSYYYASVILDVRASEVGEYLHDFDNFSRDAKELVRIRPDILYLTLIDGNGVVKRSYGGANGKNMKKFTIPTSDKHTIILGLREFGIGDSVGRSLVWSLLITGVFLLCYFFLRFVFSLNENFYLDKLSRALNTVANSDYTARLDIDKKVSGDSLLLRLYESFNLMLSQIVKSQGGTEVISSHFQPQIVIADGDEEQLTKNVITFVNKITGIDEFPTILSPEEYNELIENYRNEVTSIIANYGGTIEAIFQDEIVAFFNTPEELQNPELKAISAGVEVLQTLAVMNKDRKLDSTKAVSGKIGIDIKSVPFISTSGAPQSVKEIITHARRICDASPQWKVMVSSEILSHVRDHVDVKEYEMEDQTIFSIIGVEADAAGA